MRCALAILAALPLVTGCASPRTARAQAIDPGAHPQWTVNGSLGGGELSHENFDATTVDDGTGAGFGRVRLEFVEKRVGGGAQIEWWTADDDLHENNATGPAETGGFELYPHFTFRPTGGDRFRIPMRIGPSLHLISQEFDSPSVGDVLYVSSVLQLEVEPEFDLVQEDDFRLGLFGTLRGGTGFTIADFENTLIDETFETDMLTGGIELGTRLGFGAFEAGVSYIHRVYAYDRSDPEGGVVIKEADFDFDGILLTFGGRW